MTNIFSNTDIRGSVGETLTTEYIWNAGKAFAEWLPDEGSIVVQTAETDGAAHALIEGLLLQGRDVLQVAAGDPVALTTAITDNQAAGGAVVQYEPTQNLAVITLFDRQGTAIIGASLGEISQLAEAGNVVPAPEKGKLGSVVATE